MKNLISPKIIAYLLKKGIITLLFKNDLNQIDFKIAKMIVAHNKNMFIHSFLSFYKDQFEYSKKKGFENYINFIKEVQFIHTNWYKQEILKENCHHVDHLIKNESRNGF